MVWRDVKVRYKQSLLGVTWAIIQPLFTMIIFFLLFNKLAKMPSDGIPYPIFSYSALVAWTFFSGAVTYASNSLVGNSNLLTKVYFPRTTIPCAAVLSGVLDFAIASVALVGVMGIYQIVPSWGLLLWPLLMVPLVLLALGVSMFLSALNVKYRDTKYVVPFMIQLWMFVTPIIYPIGIVPERYQILMALNPLTGIIEALRSSVLPDRHIDWHLFAISLAITALIFAIGVAYFRKVERSFADLI